MGSILPFWATEQRQDYSERYSDGRAGASSSSGRRDCSDSSQMDGEEGSRAKRQRTHRPALAVPPDGCSWHKYGQKHLTGSNLMRNYYRCARFKDLGCCSRKTVDFEERDLQVLAVVYPEKEHNHPVTTGVGHTGIPWPGGGGVGVGVGVGVGGMHIRNGSTESVGEVEFQLRLKNRYDDPQFHFQNRQRFELQDRDYGSPDPMVSLGLGLGLQGPYYEEQKRDQGGAGGHEGAGWGLGGDVERVDKDGGLETKRLAVW